MELAGNICPWCGVDPDEWRDVDWSDVGYVGKTRGHDCYCVYENRIRIAIGICCARMLGVELMGEEDFHNGAPWSDPRDCHCRETEFEARPSRSKVL